MAAISVNLHSVPAVHIFWNYPTYDITPVHLTVRHVQEVCTVIHDLHWDHGKWIQYMDTQIVPRAHMDSAVDTSVE